jgi:hypothetical protein
MFSSTRTHPAEDSPLTANMRRVEDRFLLVQGTFQARSTPAKQAQFTTQTSQTSQEQASSGL